MVGRVDSEEILIEVDILAHLAVGCQMAHWRVFNMFVIKQLVDLIRHSDVYGAALPACHAVVEDSLLVTNNESVALEPSVFDDMKVPPFPRKK